METIRPTGQNGSGARDADGSGGEPSLGSSLESLVGASQSVITNRIELALLEGRELLARSVRGAAFIALAVIFAAAGWFTAVAGGVLFALPDAGPVVHLAAFALLNGGCAIVLVALATRRGRPPARRNGSEASPIPALDPSTEGKGRRGND